MIGHAYDILLVGAMIVLGILIIVSIVRSVLGPGISDRVIAVNMIGTIIIMVIAILSVYLDEGYLVDVCLIYAMISFLGVVVLCKVYTGVYLQRKHMKANLEAVEDNLQHQEEAVESVNSGVGGAGEAAEDGNSEDPAGITKADTVGTVKEDTVGITKTDTSGITKTDPAGIMKAENERPQKEAR